VDVADIDQTTFDLSVKHPNRNNEVQHRNPQDIMAEIAKLDAESVDVLAKIRKLL
jgi:type I restriction enzyme M protein